MSASLFSRRDFSRTLGSLAVAFAAPRLPLELDDRQAKPAPLNSIRLNFNENPYGPSPKALEALGFVRRSGVTLSSFFRARINRRAGKKV